MRILILGLLGLAASVLLALAVKEDNGYILIGYGQWTVEGSLAFFLLMNLLLFGALYLTLRIISRLGATPRKLHDWREHRGAKRARKALTQGLVELSEGNWKRAERDLVRFAGKSETPLLNYLAAARSAQQQDAHERRDHYLQLAHESMPEADVAVGLTQAELQLDHAQLEQALATLKHLREIAPRHTHVLKLLKELYQRLGDWREMGQLLPELKKRKVVEPDELQALELRVFQNQLTVAAQDENLTQLQTVWNRIPAAIRFREEMVTTYVNHLMNRGEHNQVERVLHDAIDRHWSDDLVELYGRVPADDSARHLSMAEAWLKNRPRSPVLLLTLGQLCLGNKLWGKARTYLEASIGIEPSSAAYRALGALLEKMDEKEKALSCFKAGLELSSEHPAPMALPASLKLPAAKPDNAEAGSAETRPKLEVVNKQ
ncbi:heme biosynthesis HemY N-terminal domain-containing protein [Sedimenticola selenatireducens]|uniref:heme biosynthesis HemY N-terminal domain-containing protein n=1 Tax=Sedimenticola selenatireducens TaxID=191960 RepID=UPI00049217B2|nr:heme biosynthesis HemY N-terminal domain-containing protein [Sedimenticola selenatireducens]